MAPPRNLGCAAVTFYFVYIVTNRPRGVLYVGVTNDLARRISQHRL
jgi:predicted GIY-YIG superfamily endonuclease